VRAVICGAGIAGLTLALLLDDLGWTVTVIEKAPGPRTQGYMMDFFGPGFEAVEAMGLLPALKERGYTVSEASYVDDRGRRRSGLPYAAFAEAMDGRLLSIMRPDLEAVLREALSSRVDLRFGVEPHQVQHVHEGVVVWLSDGLRSEADVLIGADGIHSAVRRLVFGSVEPRHLGFQTSAFVVPGSGLREQVEGRFCLTDTTDRVMGLYGLRDGSVAAFTAHRTSERGMPDDVRDTVRREFDSLGWIVPEVLDRCPPSEEMYYDNVAQVELRSWSHGRVVLVGDACYAVSLLAGQGASLAIAGSYLLARLLAESPSPQQAFARYERVWRPVVEDRQRTARTMVRWFVPLTPVHLYLRRLVLKLVGLPWITRRVAVRLGGRPLPPLAEIVTIAAGGGRRHPGRTSHGSKTT
jgi:2-polyprenyl-6-methoxyphenol hydroxylase-like FAD-dependent oxidoreductase